MRVVGLDSALDRLLHLGLLVDELLLGWLLLHDLDLRHLLSHLHAWLALHDADLTSKHLHLLSTCKLGLLLHRLLHHSLWLTLDVHSWFNLLLCLQLHVP